MSWWRTASNNGRDPFEPFATGRFGFKSAHKKYGLEIKDGAMSEGGASERLGRNVNYASVWMVVGLAVLMMLALLVKVYWLQVVRGEFYRNLSEGNRIRIKKVPAERGLIYDRNQRPLVHNVANFLLYAIPADLPTDEGEREALFKKIAELVPGWQVQATQEQLGRIGKNSYEAFQPLFLADNLDYESALTIYLTANQLPGIFLSSTSRRQYDLPSWSFSHLLGYTGKISQDELTSAGNDYSMIDYLGKAGLEKFYENELRGVSGVKQIEVDAFGKEKKTISESVVENGRGLILSIDIPTQVRLETTMKEYLQKGGFKRASAIAMDPNNGEILALVSLPAYDNNVFAKKYRVANLQVVFLFALVVQMEKSL
jgi:penicillin-binding protein 2